MKYKYEVAISFAGEDRQFAEALANELREEGISVFYDNFYAEELWGEDLSVKLRDVYHSSSQFCIMVISENYINKMWPSHERQQAIDRMIKEVGKTYVLPVRLNGFNGDIPGMSDTISYLAVNSNEHQKIVDAFLRKIGRIDNSNTESLRKGKPINMYVPKIKKIFTDKEKNHFLKSSFDEIVNLIKIFAEETQKRYTHFEFEMEMITSRKVFYTLYKNEQQVSQFKIWIGGLFDSSSISFTHGNNIDINNDGSVNESISIEDFEGELKLKPMGLGAFGADRNKLMSPREAAEYLWQIACQHFS